MPGLGEQSVVDAVAPATVAGYVLKETIGKGGAGTVYRAARPGAPDVALKTVQAGTPAAVASLRNEIRVLRRVRHPGVVEIVDDGVEAGVPWLAMTLVHGDRLDAVFHDRSPSRRAPLDRALLTILRRIAETLAFLHGRGLVHRDLSPRNIIVRDQHPVLIDFGFASIASEEGRRRIDESTAGLGTLPYLSPEQICRDEIDARTDLYAFGCLLYEALTGRPPFVGSPQEIVRAHLTSPVVPPSHIAPGVSPELDAVVGALLAKDRRARTGYALDVVDRLAVLGADGLPESASARPQTYLYGCSLVGRKDIVGELEAALAEACGGSGSLVCLAGESGVGKTRLLAEAVRLSRPLGMTVVSGRCVSVDAEAHRSLDPSGGPLHPLRSLLQLAADRCRDGGAAEVAQLFGSEQPLIADLDSTLRQVIGPVSSRPVRSPEGVREQVLTEAKHLLQALAAQGPLLVLFDDLQWGDELTFALLESMRRDLFEGVPLAVLGAYRNDEIGQKRGDALREAAGRTLDIERLDRASAELIVREMLGIPEGRSPILEDVLSDAQGNPFFLTEYMRTALAQGWLRRGRTGEWTLQAPGRDALLVAQKLPLPESVKVLFRRRLADLDEDTRGVLLAAAVLGGDVPFCCLRDVSPEMPPERLLDALDDLCERQILESRPQGSAFTHDKIRETVLDLTSEEDKKKVHLRAAVCLEAHRGKRDHPPVSDEALGHHFAAGGEPARALVHLDRAGDIAFRSGAHRAAAEVFGRVLELMEQAGGPPDPVRAATWRRKRGEARFAVGDVEGCIEDSKAALALLGHPVPASGPGWTLRVVAGLAMVLLVGTLTRLRRPGARATDRLEAARCAGQLASSYYFTLDLTPMLAVLLWGLLWAWRSGRAELVIEAQARLAYVAGVAGLPRLAHTLFARAGKLAVHKDHRAAKARALYLEALHGLGLGDWKRVVTLAESAAEVLAQIGDLQDAEIAQTVAAHADYYQGDVTTAAVGFEAVLVSARARTNVQHLAWGLFLTARSALAADRVPEAVASLEEARRILQPMADRPSLAIAEGLLASAYVRANDAAAASAVLAVLLPRLSRGVMPLPPCFDAYLGAAEAAVGLWRADRGSREREHDARRAVRALERFAGLFPLARPAAHRLRAAILSAQGRARAAAAELRASGELADRLGMKLEAVAARRTDPAQP
jgi:tetratricopeptide (TPR) repeat protein/predicted Ser/Thr protein kinase